MAEIATPTEEKHLPLNLQHCRGGHGPLLSVFSEDAIHHPVMGGNITFDTLENGNKTALQRHWVATNIDLKMKFKCISQKQVAVWC